MKKILLTAVCVVASFNAWSQQGPGGSSSLRVSTAVEKPTSSIDLLKKSAEKSSVAGTADGVAPASQAAPSQASAPVQTAPAAQNASAAQPSNVSAPQAVNPAANAVSTAQNTARTNVSASAAKAPASGIPAAKPASSASTLEMPLEMGGTAQTVQTSVEPVKKQVSPKAAKRVAQSNRRRAAKKPSVKNPKQAAASAPKQAAKPTALEQDIEKSNALLPASQQTAAEEDSAEVSEEEAAADAELEYAVRMLEESKQAAQSAGRKIPPSASQNKPKTVPSPNKKFNPNAFRPGVTWQPSKSTHFDIYTQKRSSGISSSNMSMTFESAYQTLRRFIPWMMSGRVRVFVYQDHDSYLRHEPNAKAWTRALAYPTRGEIVVYDEPGKNQELKEVFTHELTHIFTQQFFDKHKTGRIMTPTWLDEGLAVLMEDQAYNGMKGGPWANDLKT